MTRVLSLVAAIAAAAASTAARTPAPQAKALDPVGTYSVSTASDTGAPMTGTLVVANGPDGYTGSFSSPVLPAPVVIASVTSNAKQIMVTLNNGRGGFVLVWIEIQPDDTFKGTWHDLSPGVAATGKKGR